VYEVRARGAADGLSRVLPKGKWAGDRRSGKDRLKHASTQNRPVSLSYLWQEVAHAACFDARDGGGYRLRWWIHTTTRRASRGRDGIREVRPKRDLLRGRGLGRQFEILSRDHRVVRYDASAHGQSALPPDAYWDHADLRGLLDHLAIDRAVLVGLSLGGRIAIDLVLEDPQRVEAVVAVSSGLGGYRFTSEDYLKHRDAMMVAWKAGEFEDVVEAFQRSWTDGPHRMPEEVDPLVREQVRAPPAIDRLLELEVPMLVVVGELDVPGILEIAGLLVDADPNAELVVVPGVAHMVNMEKPEDFNRILLDYLERF